MLPETWGWPGGLPELLRNKGGASALQGLARCLARAEEFLQQALDWAGCDGTLAWELRAAIGLARLQRGQGQQAGARDLLASVCESGLSTRCRKSSDLCSRVLDLS
jgi:hypothetical protein